MPRHGLRAAAVLLLITTSCAGPSLAPTAVITPSPSPPASPLETEPANAAPLELQGKWQTSDGELIVLLTLRETSYVIEGLRTGQGAIVVHGDEIVFQFSTLCDGVGTYRWSRQGDSLTFTTLEPRDPCVDRMGLLEGRTYIPAAS